MVISDDEIGAQMSDEDFLEDMTQEEYAEYLQGLALEDLFRELGENPEALAGVTNNQRGERQRRRARIREAELELRRRQNAAAAEVARTAAANAAATAATNAAAAAAGDLNETIYEEATEGIEDADSDLRPRTSSGAGMRPELVQGRDEDGGNQPRAASRNDSEGQAGTGSRTNAARTGVEAPAENNNNNTPGAAANRADRRGEGQAGGAQANGNGTGRGMRVAEEAERTGNDHNVEGGIRVGPAGQNQAPRRVRIGRTHSSMRNETQHQIAFLTAEIERMRNQQVVTLIRDNRPMPTLSQLESLEPEQVINFLHSFDGIQRSLPIGDTLSVMLYINGHVTRALENIYNATEEAEILEALRSIKENYDATREEDALLILQQNLKFPDMKGTLERRIEFYFQDQECHGSKASNEPRTGRRCWAC